MSVDTKKPKGRRARKARKAPITEFRCQFCGKAALIEEWTKDGYDHCPHCNLMPMEDDGCGVGWGT